MAPVPDKDFLQRFALAAPRLLGVDFFAISRLNPYSNIMRTICFVVDGKLAPPISYSLDGTPCARALDDEFCVHHDHVAEAYPRDTMLRDEGIEGYAGATLMSSTGKKLGVVLCLKRTPIENEELIRLALDAFLPRISAAIETTELVERYSWAIEEATDGVWDWDVITGGTSLSPSVQDMLGYAKDGGPYDLTQIEAAMHPEDRSRHAAALREHLNTGALFDLQIRLKDRSGAYRWFRSRAKAIRTPDGRPTRMIGSFTDIHDLVAVSRRAAS